MHRMYNRVYRIMYVQWSRYVKEKNKKKKKISRTWDIVRKVSVKYVTKVTFYVYTYKRRWALPTERTWQKEQWDKQARGERATNRRTTKCKVPGFAVGTGVSFYTDRKCAEPKHEQQASVSSLEVIRYINRIFCVRDNIPPFWSNSQNF